MVSRVCNVKSVLSRNRVCDYGHCCISLRLISLNPMDETLRDLLVNKYPSWMHNMKIKEDGSLLFENVDINNIIINVHTFYDDKLQAHMISVWNIQTGKESTYKIMDSTSPAWDTDYIAEIGQIVERLANDTNHK